MTGRQEYDRTKDRQRILGKYMIDTEQCTLQSLEGELTVSTFLHKHKHKLKLYSLPPAWDPVHLQCQFGSVCFELPSATGTWPEKPSLLYCVVLETIKY